jgi:hypothetical protein
VTVAGATAVLAAATGSDWTTSGALLTFFFPIGLFIVIATSLYLEFTRPHAVPGLAATGRAKAAEPPPPVPDPDITTPDEPD